MARYWYEANISFWICSRMASTHECLMSIHLVVIWTGSLEPGEVFHVYILDCVNHALYFIVNIVKELHYTTSKESASTESFKMKSSLEKFLAKKRKFHSIRVIFKTKQLRNFFVLCIVFEWNDVEKSIKTYMIVPQEIQLLERVKRFQRRIS